MSRKFLTYFFGFDYKECTPLFVAGTTLEAIAEELTPLLLPDKVQFKKRMKSVVFVHQMPPRHNAFQSIQLYNIDKYYVYQVESTVFESDLSQLVTRYDMDMQITIFSFMTGLSATLITLLFLFQKVTGISNPFYEVVQDFYFLIPVFIILKSFSAYFIYADIEAYREKLRRF